MTGADFTDDVIDAMARRMWDSDIREHRRESVVNERSWEASKEMYRRRARAAADVLQERDDAREPSDDEIANRFGMEGGIAYSTADTRDEDDPTL